jgi:hypothetical protein
VYGKDAQELHDALGSVRQTLDDAGAPLSATGQSYKTSLKNMSPSVSTAS